MRALARIDTGAIARNTARLARAADGAAVCAVVKSGLLYTSDAADER
jgi:alanine racemase